MQRSTDPLIIFGINAVTEKLKSSPSEISELLIDQGRDRQSLHPLVEEAHRRNVAVRHVGLAELNALASGGSHQGVVALTASYAYSVFDDLIRTGTPLPITVLILDGITDPRNLGAMLRSAEGAGVRHVVIPKDRAAGVTPVAMKSSAGAIAHLKIYRVPNVTRALQALKSAGYWLVGLDNTAQQSIYEVNYPEALGIVLGSEGAGIRPLVRRQCDFLLSIPMLGKVGSLNVSVAGAVVLYEVVRQRRSAAIANGRKRR